MKLAAFPPDAEFLPALAKAWLSAPGDIADGLILLPNRRAARALAGAFLQANGGKALLLPRITALAALDETALSLAGLDLPPAIQPLRRQALLAQLILRLEGANGAPNNLPAAWALAADLAALLDEADFAGIDLASALPGVVAAELAAHWQTTLDFLQILTHAWPKILAGEAALNPAARHAKLLDAQREAWTRNPPARSRIWLVAREADPATARLARAIATLPNGMLIFPGYDDELPDEAWETLEDSHPQAGIAHLLGEIGARRDEIIILPAASNVPAGRVKLLSRALLPAACLTDWQSATPLDTTGISLLAAREEEQDSTAIAMVLRDALETPGRTAALITPDRALATRVAATLKRFGINADDSAGEPLEATPPAVLLRLLARAAISDYAPLPLLASLKHPLAAAGLPPGRCRELARALERGALRGPRPPPGLGGIRFRLTGSKHRAEADFLTRLERILAPLSLPEAGNPGAALRALLAAAESLAATAQESGAAILWSGEAGTALCEHLLETLTALEPLPDMPAARLADLLDAVLAGQVIRRPRAKDGHPRVAIWGIQEAALQSVDVAVLGGLNEGVWPAAADPGPWLSRPMRKAAGLPAPEQEIGAAAHDFFALAAACPNVILSAPKRRERAPAVPSRWITRLEAMLAGVHQQLPVHDAASWAAQLDMPTARLARPKPKPLPPAHVRPTTLSISDIATLIADPYAIYARKILGVIPLPDLDEESDQSRFGNIVHAGLQKFFTLERDFAAPATAAELTSMLQDAMRDERPRAALQHWWEARLERIAAWIITAERDRRATNPPVAMELEIQREMPINGGFTLKGRADRIEKRADGSVFIMDYKTGTPPSEKEVFYGSAPQLPLEAVMAEAGAFGPDFCAPVTELAYWHLSGRHEPGEDKPLFDKKPDDLRKIIDTAAQNLPALFARFADPATPYLAKPHPNRQTYEDTYAGISRRGEWSGGDDDGS